MKGIFKALVRWPMYSIPRLMLTLVALVAVGLTLNALGSGRDDTRAPTASAEATASDGGGATAEGAQEAEKAARGALREFVGRGAPDSTAWQQAMTYYATPELIESLSAQPWGPAADAPLHVESVAVADAASDGGTSTPTRWEHELTVDATAKDASARTFRFRVVAEKQDDEWIVTGLEEVH